MTTVNALEVGELLDRYLADRVTEEHVRLTMAAATADLALFVDVTTSLGLADVFLPTWHGGLGVEASVARAVFEQLGQTLAEGPFLPTFGHAVPLLAALGPNAEVTALLDRVRAGEGLAVLVDIDVRTEGSAVPGRTVSVTGSFRTVPGGSEVTAFLVPIRCGADLAVVSVDRLDSGVEVTPVGCLDPTRRLADVDFAGAPGLVLHTDMAQCWESALDAVDLACAASSLGSSRRLLRLAVDHAATRWQFGRPIGSFQAVKHRCARMLIEQRLAEAALERATQAGRERCPIDVSVSTLAARQATQLVGAGALQVFGGIGFTWEHPAHLYFKRLTVDRHLAGAPHRHLRRINEHLGI